MILQPIRGSATEGATMGGRLRTAAGTRVKGKGFTSSKGTTGVYIITFDRKWPSIIGAAAIVFSATDLHARVTALPSTGASITFTVSNNSGTATDLGASDELLFLLYVAESSLG